MSAPTLDGAKNRCTPCYKEANFPESSHWPVDDCACRCATCGLDGLRAGDIHTCNGKNECHWCNLKTEQQKAELETYRP